jgi:hypothetical protein
MKVYAIPAYYDGRARVNLKGRESHGIVPRESYKSALEEAAGLIRECCDPITGDPLEVEIELNRRGDPRDRHPTDADLFVRCNKDYYAFRHPRLGLIGPAPCRRPGGHTGGPGAGYYLDRSGAGKDLGSYSVLDVSDAVAALAGGGNGSRPLAEALLRVGERNFA